MALVKNSSSTKRDRWAGGVEEKWSDEQATHAAKSTKKVTLGYKAATIDLGRVDLVRWLAGDEVPNARGNRRGGAAGTVDPTPVGSTGTTPTSSADPAGGGDAPPHSAGDVDPAPFNKSGMESIESPVTSQVEEIGRSLQENVLADISQAYGGELPDPRRKALADHFWCDLLAHLAHAMSEGLKLADAVPDYVTDAIMKSREQTPHRAHIERFVVKAGVDSAWKNLREIALAGALTHGKALLPAVRTLAILICKSPERHEAVVTYCLDPMKEQLRRTTKQRLLEVLPEWFPQLSEQFHGASAPRAGAA